MENTLDDDFCFILTLWKQNIAKKNGHIINHLLTELARSVLENIRPRSFLYGPRLRLGPYCQDLGLIFSSTDLALG